MNKETKWTGAIVALLVVIAVLIAAIFGMVLKDGKAEPEQEPTAVTLPAEETAAPESVSETEPKETRAETQETAPEATESTEKPAAGNNPTEPTTPATEPPANNPPAESDDDIVEGELGLGDNPFDDE